MTTGHDKLPQPVHADQDEPALIVGRERELAQLLDLYEAACVGRRQIVLVTGALGIGKSTLVQEFLRILSCDEPDGGALHGGRVRIGRGHCFRRYATAEPYAPLLSALTSVTADRRADDAVWNGSPTWLAQMPALLSQGQLAHLRRSLLGTGNARMLREGVTLVERLSEEQPLVLVLHNIHRADWATLDWLTQVAPRVGDARLLIIATMRPPNRARGTSPIHLAVGSLQEHPGCVTSVVLEPIPRQAAREYVDQRLADRHVEPRVRAALADASQGNPLFLQTLVDDALGREAISEPLPSNLRELLTRWREELSDADAAVLEAGATTGTSFSVHEVAAALGQPPAEVLAACERLSAAHRFLRPDPPRVPAPAGARYAFRHLLLLQAISEHTASAQRRRLHAALAGFLEREHAGDLPSVTSRLIWHFEAAGDGKKHAQYLELAASNVAGRFAYREMADLIERVIAVLHRLPDTRELALREAARQLDYGNLIVALWGFGDFRAHRAYERALEQARHQGDQLLMFRAHLGRCLSSLITGDIAVKESSAALLEIVGHGHAELASVGHLYNSYVSFAAGRFAEAVGHAVTAEQRLSQALRGVPIFFDLEAFVHVSLALALTPMGSLEDAHAHRQRAQDRLDSHGFPYQRVSDLAILATTAMMTDDVDTTLLLAEKSMALAERYGVHAPPLLAGCCRAWALCRRGIGALEAFESVVEERARAREIWFQSLLFVALAELCCERGNLERAVYWQRRAGRLRGETAFEAERWRVRGRIVQELAAKGQRLHDDVPPGQYEIGQREPRSAEACFAEALRIARSQGAKLFEQRAALAPTMRDSPDSME